MSSNNPFNGGPDYPAFLATTFIESKKNRFCPPPASGGQQISIRLRPERLALVDLLSKQSSWSRNQIIDAVLDTGLKQFFNCLPDSEANDLVDRIVASVAGELNDGGIMNNIANALDEFNHSKMPVTIEDDKITVGNASMSKTLRITKQGQGFYLDDTFGGIPNRVDVELARHSPTGRPLSHEQMLTKARSWMQAYSKFYK